VKSKNGLICFAVNGLVRSVQEQNGTKPGRRLLPSVCEPSARQGNPRGIFQDFTQLQRQLSAGYHSMYYEVAAFVL